MNQTHLRLGVNIDHVAIRRMRSLMDQARAEAGGARSA